MADIGEKPKLKLAVYWGAACGGCCVSVLDVMKNYLMLWQMPTWFSGP